MFQQVIDHARSIKTLESVIHLITWDLETMMPAGGLEHRTNQTVLLSGLVHAKKTDPVFYANLQKIASSISDEQSDDAIIVKKMLRDVEKAKKLPQSFVEEFSAVTSQAWEAWKRAKALSQFDLFLPNLEHIVDLVRKKADFLGYEDHPYDALIDEFEPETTTQEIDTLFRRLSPKLKNLLQEIRQTAFYEYPYTPIPTTQEEQLTICKKLLTFIGFDWNKGRLDTSEHPFSTCHHPTDTRITIRHTSNDLLNQIGAALHEAGHGLYEMGFARQYFGTPLAEAVSCSIHESQSRFWETIVGQSQAFMPHIFDAIQHINSQSYKNIDQLYHAINSVRCSPIRIEADEVTYPFHVIVRFMVEKELITGDLKPKDVPDRWNELIRDFVGFTPKNDSEGCLQDIHWSIGSIGYFPSYTLGSLYAICFGSAIRKSLPNFDELIQQGSFDSIIKWLHDQIWKQGRRFSSRELVERTLGRAPNEDDYIAYLRKKYVG